MSVDGRPAPLRPALREMGLRAAEISLIAHDDTSLGSSRTFLARTADGRELKARIGDSARAAAHACALAQSLADPRIPVSVGRVGRVTFESWVEGVVLSAVTATAQQVDAVADLVAAVHAFGGVADERLPQQRQVGWMISHRLRQIEGTHPGEQPLPPRA